MQPSHPTRERLINEAVAMLGEMAPEDIKVADVLNRSLATKGSLYHFFTDLSDLLEEAYLRRFGEQLQVSIDAIRTAVDAASTPQEFQQVLERVTAATQGVERAPMRIERARVIVMAQSNERFGKKLGVMQQQLTDALTECFADAQAKGLLGSHFQPRTGAVFIQAYTLGRIVDDVGDGALDDEDWNRLINRLVLTLLAD